MPACMCACMRPCQRAGVLVRRRLRGGWGAARWAVGRAVGGKGGRGVARPAVALLACLPGPSVCARAPPYASTHPSRVCAPVLCTRGLGMAAKGTAGAPCASTSARVPRPPGALPATTTRPELAVGAAHCGMPPPPCNTPHPPIPTPPRFAAAARVSCARAGPRPMHHPLAGCPPGGCRLGSLRHQQRQRRRVRGGQAWEGIAGGAGPALEGGGGQGGGRRPPEEHRRWHRERGGGRCPALGHALGRHQGRCVMVLIIVIMTVVVLMHGSWPDPGLILGCLYGAPGLPAWC